MPMQHSVGNSRRVIGAILQAHEADDVGKIYFVRLQFGEARQGACLALGRPQPRQRHQVLKILEDLCRIEDLGSRVDEHRHLALRIDAQNLGMRRLVQASHVERHHDQLERQPFSSMAIWALAPNMLRGPE